MDKLEKLILKKSFQTIGSKPIIFDLSQKKDQKYFLNLINQGYIRFINDAFEEQLKELYQIKNPNLVYKKNFENRFNCYLKRLKKNLPLYQIGRWAYFPWLLTAVHILNENDYFLVRTARNKNLINVNEQKKFYNACIGIAGLSVGNSVALTIVLEGGSKRMKLADFDNLTLSNTNRIRAGIEALGIPKIEITARQIYLLNPYAQLELYPEGLNENNIERFFNDIDIVIDEVDNIVVKILIRQHAKKKRIPVLMGTDNGDNILVDIERYDLNKNITPFHGRITTNLNKIKGMNKMEIGKLITKFVGIHNVTTKMQQSLLEMGKTIVSWPQLGGAALLNGCALTYCVRKILNNQSILDKRANISLDEILDPSFNTKQAKIVRKKTMENFRKIFRV